MNVQWAQPDCRPATPGRGTMRAITSEVAARHGMSLEDLLGQDRHRVFVLPRHEAIALIYKTGRFSMPQIGRFFGNRDHTSILHALRAHRERQEEARASQ